MTRKHRTSDGDKIPDAVTADDRKLVAVDEEALEERVQEALTEPGELTTIAEFKRRMDEFAKADGYLNYFHPKRSERSKANLAKQPKDTLEWALAQYERIKQGSKRRAEDGSSPSSDPLRPKQEQV